MSFIDKYYQCTVIHTLIFFFLNLIRLSWEDGDQEESLAGKGVRQNLKRKTSGEQTEIEMSGPVTQQCDILCQFLKRLFYISNVCDIWVLVVPNIEKVIPAAVVVFTCTKAGIQSHGNIS